jgi:beta-xylosidase
MTTHAVFSRKLRNPYCLVGTFLALFMFVGAAILLSPIFARAATNNNPVLSGYNADPQIAVFNHTFYMYPTTDGIANWGATSFQVWSSTDMVHWTNHGVILNLANVSWCHSNAWSPSIAKKGSTYYFYFTACGQIGVATSSSPTGPFTDALGKPLVASNQYGVYPIDPAVFIDGNGQPYLLFGNGGARLGTLNANMTSFNGTPVNITPAGASYREAPYMFKRNGTYYLTWSEDDTRNATYHVSYAKASSITGPFTAASGNPILSENTSLGILGTGSASIWGASTGQYYIVYHRFGIPGGDGTHREVAIDPLNFNADGTIQHVAVSLTGLQSSVSANPNNSPAFGATSVDDEAYGTQQNQFNYSGSGWLHGACTGCYNNTNSWDNTSNQYVTITFTGTQIALYGVKDPKHGIGAVSIDGGTETNIDFYAATRGGNQLLWTSSTLSSGSHTFKLRVAGTKNASSSGTWVVPDRVDITP